MTIPITIRLEDNKHQRLKVLAKQKDISINRLIDEIITIICKTPDLTVTNFPKVSVRSGLIHTLFLPDRFPIDSCLHVGSPTTVIAPPKRPRRLALPPACCTNGRLLWMKKNPVRFLMKTNVQNSSGCVKKTVN